jgi:hypothetical protein
VPLISSSIGGAMVPRGALITLRRLPACELGF